MDAAGWRATVNQACGNYPLAVSLSGEYNKCQGRRAALPSRTRLPPTGGVIATLIRLCYRRSAGAEEAPDGLRFGSNTPSKSARLSPAKVNRVRDLGCRFSVVCAERFRTQANETRNETRA